MLKRMLKGALNFVVRRDPLWKVWKRTVVPLADYSQYLRMTNDVNSRLPAVQAALEKIAPDLVVRHGPFRGMKYPAMKSVGSSLVPKLLGSYEMELHPTLEAICASKYDAIVDVGCAEGYYAVGLARRVPGAKVYAYDTLPEATAACRAMAEANGVADRLTTGAFCDPAALKAVPLGRGLLVCDCEGYEKELFTPDVIPHLANSDVLIEVHDFIDIEISTTLRERFRGTHALQVVRSVDDIAKAHTYDFPELAGYDRKGRKFLLGEGRPAIMEWFFLTPLAQ